MSNEQEAPNYCEDWKRKKEFFIPCMIDETGCACYRYLQTLTPASVEQPKQEQKVSGYVTQTGALISEKDYQFLSDEQKKQCKPRTWIESVEEYWYCAKCYAKLIKKKNATVKDESKLRCYTCWQKEGHDPDEFTIMQDANGNKIIEQVLKEPEQPSEPTVPAWQLDPSCDGSYAFGMSNLVARLEDELWEIARLVGCDEHSEPDEVIEAIKSKLKQPSEGQRLTDKEIEVMAYSINEKFESIFIPAVQRARFGKLVRDEIYRKGSGPGVDTEKETFQAGFNRGLQEGKHGEIINEDELLKGFYRHIERVTGMLPSSDTWIDSHLQEYRRLREGSEGADKGEK